MTYPKSVQHTYLVDVCDEDKDRYRFGFGGHEKVNEIAGMGNHLSFNDYGFDTRIVKRWNRDPKAAEYPNQSPYSVFNGNPIFFDDPTGESGEVAINKKSKTITVSSKMIFYGNEASSKLSKSTARDVQDKWNAAKGTVKIDGVTYKVKFKVTSEYKPDLTPDEVAKNTSIKNNYIRVEKENAQGISYMDAAGSNTGYYLTRNIENKGSTTEGREMGHGFGLEHPSNGDFRGRGQPSIMYARGTLVDPEYQYDPKVAAGQPGGTMNPETKKVAQEDIDDLGLDKLQYDENGKADLGKTTNQYHNDETPAKTP